MVDQQVSAMRISLEGLIPGTKVEWTIGPLSKLRELLPNLPDHGGASCGEKIRPDEVLLWFRLADGGVCIFRLRPGGRLFSQIELRMLNYFSSAFESLLIDPEQRALRTGSRIASRYTFEHLLVARFVRRLKNA